MRKYENFCNALSNMKDIYNYEEPYDNCLLYTSVAEYILQHLDSFSYSTLAKLSKEISVSETTIIRLSLIHI